jgi:hypothetical protein
MVLLQYATFAYRESGKSTQDLNVLLDNIGIKKLPETNNAVQDNGNTPPHPNIPPIQQHSTQPLQQPQLNNYIAPHTSPQILPQKQPLALHQSIDPMLLTPTSGYGFSDTVHSFQRRISENKKREIESSSDDGEYLNVHHLDNILYEDIPINERWEKALKTY